MFQFRVLLFLFMLQAAGAPGWAQGFLTGMVEANRQPAAFATVTLGTESQVTDSSGRFRFPIPNTGRYVLQVSAVGYEPYRKTMVLQAAEEKNLLIELQANASSLDAVVVTGTLKPVKRLESPIAVEVYSPQFFKKNPSPSIFESLQQVNGVRPQINCSVCNTGDIHINGLEGPYTMVTIDGMPIVSSLSSVYGLFGIPSELIERVEIVKGPASGLYGSEAIGGLINIITKSPEKAPLFSATLMTTGWQEHTADLGVKWKAGKNLQSLLGIHYFNYQQPHDKNEDGFTDVTLQHRVSAFNKWSLLRPQNRVATLAGRYFYENRWGGQTNWNKEFRGGDSVYGESIYTRRWELIGNYQLPATEKIFFSFSATGHHQDSWYGTTPYLAKQKIVFGQLTWDLQAGPASSLLLGLAGRYNHYDDNSTATIDTLNGKNAPDQSFIPGIFAQEEWKISPDHTLLAGLRYDHHPAHGSIITPRLASKWRMSEQQTFRLNSGTGFRVVNLFTEDHAALTGSRAVEIREALKPEKSYNVNLNFTRQMGSRSWSWNLDASLWYSYFANQIFANYEADPRKIIYENLKGHALSKGFTLNVETNIKQRLKALLGITLQQVDKVEKINGIRQRVRPMLTENWSGTWQVSYSIPLAGMSIDYTGNIYGPMRLPLVSSLDPRQPESPVWSIQNIQVTKRFSARFEWFGGVKNLLNWTPPKNNPFLIARTQDPFNKKLEYDNSGKILSTAENPYALSFDPAYIYAPNQGLRLFTGIRFNLRD